MGCKKKGEFMELIKININDLKQAEYNPRKELKPSDAEYQKIKRSLEEFGYVDPIIVNKDMTIIGGHQRCNVMKELGYSEVECIVIDIDKTKEKALNVALNKITGEWDLEKLNTLILELDSENYDLTLTGFEDFEIKDILDIEIENEKEVKEDDFEIEVPEEPKAKLGDIYQLGNHRLMCGDSTKIDDVEKLMGGEKVDLLITDPPYNVDYTGKTKDALKIENDKMDNDNFHQFLYDVFVNAYSVLKDGASFYVWYASREVVNFQTSIEESGLTVKQELIWNKNSLVMGRQDYQWKHEPCLYGWKETDSHKWYGDRKQTTVIDWDRPTRSDLHPTMKPIGLFDYQIKNSSKVGDNILDLFGGSGTTIIACEQNGRKGYSMEYDPKYVDVIINRWEKFTGKKAVLIEKGEASNG